jgi:biopolymer transport protein TolR
MGMALGSSGGGGRRGRSRRHGAVISEINVTPLVDVMLVLLIVFMVAAPLMTVGVPIDLPQTQATSMTTGEKPVMVTVTPEGALFIGEDPLATGGFEQRIYVRGDATANYGAVMKVMGALSSAGYARIGLITTQERAE